MESPFLSQSARSYANDFLTYVNASPTPFHAVANAKAMLEGFTELRERDSWTGKLQKGGKYYVTRNGSSLIAFTVGDKWKPGNAMSIVGAHTDSPALRLCYCLQKLTFRLKPVSKKDAENYLQVGVETYGGGIWHSWFDRDLSVAGRVMVRCGDTFKQQLVDLKKPILRIPTLAIHLDRDVNTKFEFNTETHLTPILGIVQDTLNRKEKGEMAELNEYFKSMYARHDTKLVNSLASKLGVEVQNIQDFELLMYDTQPACLGGLNDEFIFAARQDNLVNSFCATRALIESKDSTNDQAIRLACLFDHEEIGSMSAQGALSDFLPSIITRLSSIAFEENKTSPSAYEETLRKSFLISADQAHAVHPNYPSKHESNHRPQLNMGPVIKINANSRYATNSPGIVLLKQVCNIAEVPLQLFVVKNDSPCGSTIGPLLAAKLGMRTLDIGNPQLSMHSIRETGGSRDIELSVKLFKCFFENFGLLEPQVIVD